MSRIEQFGERIAKAQDAIADTDGAVARARAVVVDGAARREPARTARWLVALAIAPAAAAAVAILVLSEGDAITATRGDDGSAVEIGEWIRAAAGSSTSIRFSDGSAVELRPDSGARVVELNEGGARVLLENGEASVRVRHRARTAWRLDVGPYEVRVTGTRFDVGWAPDEQLFTLALEEGSVEVAGPLIADGRRVAAGESLRAWVADGRMEMSSSRTTEPIASAAASPGGSPSEDSKGGPLDARLSPAAETDARDFDFPSTRAADKTSPERAEPTAAMPPASWADMARSGRYAEAVEAAQEAGLESILDEASAKDLISLGDAARLCGVWKVADDCYIRVRDRFPGTAQAAAAALALGRMAFDQQHMYSKAARWLELYVEEGGGGGLVREALGRLVEARDRAGDDAGAKAAAVRYLAEYPDGPHAAYAGRLLSEKEAP